MGGHRILWCVAARFPGIGNPDRLTLSDLRFWLDGHKAMIKEEQP